MTPARHSRDSPRDPDLRRRLLDFYDQHRRDLPWRGEEDPYRIWISEVMLQQTRVETVIPYYKRWMARFPDVDELAKAEREEVLQEWKGLGYYSRARNLHRAARIVREDHDGHLPASVGGLRDLPGVGEYTAGAVGSIAFGLPVPAVDGNVRRVLSRLDDLAGPTPAELRTRARDLVDPERPGASNQALMELGATVCTPRSPSCGSCPVEALCLARARGTIEQRPAARRRTRVDRRNVVVAVLVDGGGATLVTRRPEDGLLGGMWEFPAKPLDGGAAGASEEAEGAVRRLVRELIGALEAVRALQDGTDEGPERWTVLEPVEHRFTHLHVTYRPFLVEHPAGTFGDLEGVGELEDVGEDVLAAVDEARIVPLDALDSIPLSRAQQKIAALAQVRRDSPVAGSSSGSGSSVLSR